MDVEEEAKEASGSSSQFVNLLSQYTIHAGDGVQNDIKLGKIISTLLHLDHD